VKQSNSNYAISKYEEALKYALSLKQLKDARGAAAKLKA
jgi:hypothetical protein